ncbi:MAG TPA: amidase [Casimicrobiaceae bacterium]|nr:amidase [Casimicrobiaceae bacterium]
MTLHALSLREAIDRMDGGRLSALDYARALLERADTSDDEIEAWAHRDRDHVLREAARLDALPRDRRRVLHGVPIGVKDIVHTTSMPTRMGSPAFDHFVADDDAACVKRLHKAGAYVFGKTVTTEVAFFAPGKTRNPWNARHTPGGSSQGSAAAVAAGHVPAAIGTQTHGSIIRPAAYCGVVGFKPTVGAIDFSGVNCFSETFDTLGTFARNVADASLLAATLVDDPRLPSAVLLPARAPRLAYLPEFPWTRVGCDADDALDAAATKLRSAGADIVPVVLPDALAQTFTVHRTIMLFEGARNLGNLQATSRAKLSQALDSALDEGKQITPDDYHRALASRAAMIAVAREWIGHYDAVMMPSAPSGAPGGLETTGDPSCCTLASLIGAPAITLPTGFDGKRMPLGMQVIASPGDDANLLAIAAWCEAWLPFAGLLSARSASDTLLYG